MKCPQCGYEDQYQEPIDVGLPGYTQTVYGDFGEFYKTETKMTRENLSVKKLFGCPACKIAFIED